MAYQGISTGTGPNTGTGDTLLDGAAKVNSNFKEIYNALGDGTNLTVTKDAIAINPSFTSASISKPLDTNEFCTVVAPGVQLQLPATQVNGSKVQVCVVGGFTDTQITRPPSLGAGVKIMGFQENLTINTPNVTVTLVGVQTSLGAPNSFDWRLV